MVLGKSNTKVTEKYCRAPVTPVLFPYTLSISRHLSKGTDRIHTKSDKIRDSVEDRQSRIAWQTINEMSRRKSTAKAKLKAANQQERIKL